MLTEIRGLNEECGVFGIWGHREAAQITYYGLHSLQHRGQEGAGIVTNNGEKLDIIKGLGLINEVFAEGKLNQLSGKSAIGHVRYATAGGGGYENVQPLFFKSHTGDLAIAHNGNLVNATRLKQQLEKEGSIFQATSDTEILAHLIRRSCHGNMRDAIKESLNKVDGAFAYLIMTETEMYVALDPNGLKPLSIGKMGDAYVVASETCAFDVVGATFVRDVEPGELIVINDDGLEIDRFREKISQSVCAMEYVYFARPDSNINGINVHTARKNMGKQLAVEAGIEADIVTGVPDSSISSAIGFAEEMGIPYELGLIKNRYVGRTFIQPSQELREQGVKMKLSAVRGVVEGKRVVMVDDSIVRGTTSKRIVNLLREAGATEVHVRISSPPITHPSYYGIDISTYEELIAANHSIDEICEMIGADSLSFLSVEGLKKGIGNPKGYDNAGLCLSVFTGEYPTEIPTKEELMWFM